MTVCDTIHVFREIKLLLYQYTVLLTWRRKYYCLLLFYSKWREKLYSEGRRWWRQSEAIIMCIIQYSYSLTMWGRWSLYYSYWRNYSERGSDMPIHWRQWRLTWRCLLLQCCSNMIANGLYIIKLFVLMSTRPILFWRKMYGECLWW